MSRVILVYELTRLDVEIARSGTQDVVMRMYEERVFTSDLLNPDKIYKAELARVKRCILNSGNAIVECIRQEAQGFVFRDDDMVVILGDDGAFVNIAKLLQNQKVVTISTSTKRCGRLMKFTVDSFEKSIAGLFSGDVECVEVFIAKATTSRGHSIEAVNDFYVGRPDLRSSRYSTLFSGSFVEQVSSGVIISTGTGSTGWEKSACQTDSDYEERGFDDEKLSVITRELCHGKNLGTLRHLKEITFRSDDNDIRVLADGVLIDVAMLMLPAGATVTITSAVRRISLCY